MNEDDIRRHAATLDDLLSPVAARPFPILVMAFGVGVVTALVLRSRGVLEPDPTGSASGAGHIWSAARSAWSEAPEVAFEEIRSGPLPELDILTDVRRAALDAMTGYLDRAVDRMADATERTVRG